LNNETCVIGVDLCHPSSAAAPRGQDRKAMPSFAAVVASVDDKMTKFTHLCSAQMGGTDVIDPCDMDAMITRLMTERQKRSGNKKWPSRIIYMRDGANEEALAKLIEQEIDVIRSVYKKTSQSIPLILAIVVKKRHQTRFFPKDPKADARTNMPPGTLLMDNLTIPLQYDNFYLLSHAGIKGTSHPCRYIIVVDEFKNEIPALAKLLQRDRMKKYAHAMYQMCHLYGRCQRAVSVPAPIFYAHLLADRARIHADKICRKFTGMSVLDDVSLDSSNGRVVDQSEIDKMIPALNNSLSELSTSSSTFFYC